MPYFYSCFFLNSRPVLANTVNDTKFGIIYTIWHCRSNSDIRDISKIQAGLQDWGYIPWFHWWGEPAAGYYCLTDRPDLLKLHAEQLRDAGIDFVVIDVTNWPDYDPSPNGIALVDIINPFQKMLEVWSTVPNAPKIVPWVRLGTTGNPNRPYNDMIYWLLPQLDKYPSLYFQYQNKPLILGIGHDSTDQNLVNALTVGYTHRDMHAFYDEPSSEWSFMQRCQNQDAFRTNQGTTTCNQQVAIKDGLIEQISVTTAYQNDYISDNRTNIPKFDGKTFRRQFDAVFNNPGVPIVTITGWNEWIAQRFCIGPGKELQTTNCTSETFPDGSRIFVDNYDVNRNRDIEPSKTGKKDYYYELMKSCISLYKSGKECTVQNNDLCCKDFSEDWKIYLTPTPTKIPTAIPTRIPTPTPTKIPSPTPTNTPTSLPGSLCTQCPNLPQAKSQGDADCSGSININDVSIWRSEFISGGLGSVDKNNWHSDFNCDGKVNIIDASIWRDNFNKSL